MRGYLRGARTTFRRLYYRERGDVYTVANTAAAAMDYDASPNMKDVNGDPKHEAEYQKRRNNGGAGTC